MGLAEIKEVMMRNDHKKIKTNKYRACKQRKHLLILNLSRDNNEHCLQNTSLSACRSDASTNLFTPKCSEPSRFCKP